MARRVNNNNFSYWHISMLVPRFLIYWPSLLKCIPSVLKCVVDWAIFRFVSGTSCMLNVLSSSWAFGNQFCERPYRALSMARRVNNNNFSYWHISMLVPRFLIYWPSLLKCIPSVLKCVVDWAIFRFVSGTSCMLNVLSSSWAFGNQFCERPYRRAEPSWSKFRCLARTSTSQKEA